MVILGYMSPQFGRPTCRWNLKRPELPGAWRNAKSKLVGELAVELVLQLRRELRQKAERPDGYFDLVLWKCSLKLR
eukprot:CAMPEP_0115172256 /NCGR_PEP_ID=MMETSP0270-20121206/2721_1 /TAXON_ID=71861 /ORGANISM="Scrippsiella trochoidea, Strain CCMP3099" /LENGTH=75 /DNA_ID=CAMNT_0002585041 /DNA_START=426 /DNA_END=654 /DNA_ORIENTATION=-